METITPKDASLEFGISYGYFIRSVLPKLTKQKTTKGYTIFKDKNYLERLKLSKQAVEKPIKWLKPQDSYC